MGLGVIVETLARKHMKEDGIDIIKFPKNSDVTENHKAYVKDAIMHAELLWIMYCNRNKEYKFREVEVLNQIQWCEQHDPNNKSFEELVKISDELDIKVTEISNIFEFLDWVNQKLGWGYTITYIPWEDDEGKPRVLRRFKTTEEKDQYLHELYDNVYSVLLPEELGTVSIIHDFNYTLPV